MYWPSDKYVSLKSLFLKLKKKILDEAENSDNSTRSKEILTNYSMIFCNKYFRCEKSCISENKSSSHISVLHPWQIKHYSRISSHSSCFKCLYVYSFDSKNGLKQLKLRLPKTTIEFIWKFLNIFSFSSKSLICKLHHLLNLLQTLLIQSFLIFA
jgi:hypothetical protein